MQLRILRLIPLAKLFRLYEKRERMHTIYTTYTHILHVITATKAPPQYTLDDDNLIMINVVYACGLCPTFKLLYIFCDFLQLYIQTHTHICMYVYYMAHTHTKIYKLYIRVCVNNTLHIAKLRKCVKNVH